MAEKLQQQMSHVSGKAILLTSAAGLIIGAPLLGLMGFIFVATTTLLLVASPLLVLFSPLLFGAACVFGLAMLGFAVAGTMALVGVSMVARVLRPLASRGAGFGDKLIESGGSEAKGSDWTGYLHQKGPNPYDEIVYRA